MGQVAKAQAWMNASQALSSLSTNFMNMVPMVEQWISSEQGKGAIDEFVKRSQTIKDEAGNATDGATQLFSIMFGYDPTGDELDTEGMRLAQRAMDVVKDGVLSKDVKGLQEGLGEIKQEIDLHVGELVKAQKSGRDVRTATGGVPTFAPQETKDIRSGGFRALQERQTAQEGFKKQIETARGEVAAKFPKGQKQLGSFVEKFASGMDTKDFNQVISKFLKREEESKLNEARIKQSNASAALSKAREQFKKASNKIQVQPEVKATIDILDDDVDLKVFQLKSAEKEIKNLEKNLGFFPDPQVAQEATAKINSLQQKSSTLLREILGIQKTRKGLARKLQTGTPAEVAQSLKKTEEHIGDVNTMATTIDSLTQELNAVQDTLQLKREEETPEQPGILGRAVEGVKSFFTPQPGTAGAGAQNFSPGSQPAQDFGPSDQPEGTRARNAQQQVIVTRNGKWVLE